MPLRFYGREIQASLAGEPKVPVSFTLDGREYVIEEILEAWQDHGFGPSARSRHRWWQRRHRNYYRVKTTDGAVFEIYLDRGTKLEQRERWRWFLHRQLS
ncbi:MAG: hypothetical protein HY677_07460 [Chloroflexi bacterium]|nr:hypothetical protein [Chloroflexota bacterium]